MFCLSCLVFRSSRFKVFWKKGVLRNFTKFTGRHMCQDLFFSKKESLGLRPQACSFIKKESLAEVFFCEFCENSKNTFFTEHLKSLLLSLQLCLLLFHKIMEFCKAFVLHE